MRLAMQYKGASQPGLAWSHQQKHYMLKTQAFQCSNIVGRLVGVQKNLGCCHSKMCRYMSYFGTQVIDEQI